VSFPSYTSCIIQSRYNLPVLTVSRHIAAGVLLLLSLTYRAVAQSPAKTSQTIIVFPFDNTSGAPGLEWIGEAVPEILRTRLTSPTLYVLLREDRLRAYDELGIPANLHPSRATIYRISEQMGVDYFVVGRYGFDGRTFTATAQLVDLQRGRLSEPIAESGSLVDLIGIETALAWDLLHTLRPNLAATKDAFKETAPPIRLDGFENYIRGILATAPDEKVRRFSEALRIAPNYVDAQLQLGKVLHSQRQYDQAIAWLERVPRDNGESREASFVLGLAAYDKGDYVRASEAFTFLLSQLPLTEVYNNLGITESRRGDKNATDLLGKAVEADPSDADYRLNLALAHYRAGDLAAASRQLHEAINLKPEDAEIKAFREAIAAESIQRVQHVAATAAKLPPQRVKRNYDESKFRQLALEIQATAEQRLSQTDPHTHSQYHSARGHDLLGQGFFSEAEGEFREAISLNDNSGEAHAGLARVLEAVSNFAGAREEANAALRLKPSAEPLLVLARLDLRDNKTEAAAAGVDQALQLEPSNASALALKRVIAAKLAEKAQPLPNR